jgi:hypothetical protein
VLTVIPQLAREKELLLDMCWADNPRTGLAATGTFSYRSGTSRLLGTAGGVISNDVLLTLHLSVASATGAWCNVRGKFDLNVMPNVLTRYQRTAGTVAASLHRDFAISCPSKP